MYLQPFSWESSWIAKLPPIMYTMGQLLSTWRNIYTPGRSSWSPPRNSHSAALKCSGTPCGCQVSRVPGLAGARYPALIVAHQTDMSCIGTAGHVDHGKSTLVKVLTGIDPDRLAEEKERGMTIDLGFAWLKLPSGREVCIVDVPGHEGFIKNMLAGVGGIDAAWLVIAADEGIMPQTREHLAILDLLRVRRGLVALTKADLVDEEWIELVREEVAEQLQPTTLAGAEMIPVSAYTGEGLPALVTRLERIFDETEERQNIARPRLPIDRVFTMTGFGTVVTGTLLDGVFKTGQEVEVLPQGLKTRIRSLQTHGRQVEMTTPGNRVAMKIGRAH